MRRGERTLSGVRSTAEFGGAPSRAVERPRGAPRRTRRGPAGTRRARSAPPNETRFDELTARWARELDTGESLRLHPVVLGPRELPHLGSMERARRHVDLAVLIGLARAANPSAQARGTMGPEALDDLLAAVASVSELEDHTRRDALAWLLRSTAPSGVRATIERLLEVRDMRFVELLREEVRQEGRLQGLLEGRQEGRLEGRLEGHAEALVHLLRKRGFAVDDALEQRLRATTDLAALDRWLERVLDARSLDEVFGD